MFGHNSELAPFLIDSLTERVLGSVCVDHIFITVTRYLWEKISGGRVNNPAVVLGKKDTLGSWK